jgi:uncharacterized protein (TIGR02246 family)
MHVSATANGVQQHASAPQRASQGAEMKTMLGLFALIGFAIGNPLQAQTSQDEKAVRDLPIEFTNAWAKHDGHELAKIMAEDVDFVTVTATWLSGRADFEKYHTRLLSGQFKDALVTPLETVVRFIRSDLALVHWSWRVQGDKSADGSARPPRAGLMTMLAAKRKGIWLVVAAQNTNGGPTSSELLQDIKSPIVVSRPEQ